MSIKEFCKSKVVGTTFHDVPWDQIRVGDQLDLVREPNNKYDKYAIAVLWRGHHLGYIRATEPDTFNGKWYPSLNRELSVSMAGTDYHFAIVCEITGGTELKPNKGLNIRIMRQPLDHIKLRTYVCECGTIYYIPSWNTNVPECFKCRTMMEVSE